MSELEALTQKIEVEFEQNEIVRTALFGRRLNKLEQVMRDDGSNRAREQGMVHRVEVIETDVKEIKEKLGNGILLRFSWKEWGGISMVIGLLVAILARLLGVEIPT